MDDDQLRTVWQQRQKYDRTRHLSTSLSLLMKHNLSKKVRRLSALSAIWDELVPDELASHTALENFNRGVLVVMVDSSAHRFQLRTLLDGGLMHEMQARFIGSLNKIRLIPGQFYSVDLTGARRYEA